MAAAQIGVIGGSGFSSFLDEAFLDEAFLDDAQPIEIETPYGPPSDPIIVGTVAGRTVAFLPRHGTDHRHPPHRIPYRANLWAMRAVGVRQILAPCAVGALQPGLGPGSLVIPDQLADRTSGRSQTFHDTGAVHVAFADPYCPTGRAVAVAQAGAQGWPVTDGGTMVVVEGPRFSTRAESQWYAGLGWSVVNMTGHPEAALARELALCYTSIALVTDVDAGVASGAHVTQEEVFRVFGENTARLRTLLYAVVAGLPETRTCWCARSLDGIDHDLVLP